MTASVNSAQTHSAAQQSAQQQPASPDLFDNLRTRAKSLSDIGQNLMKQLAKNSVSRLSEIPAANSVINMTKDNQALSTTKSGTNDSPNRANQLFRQQLPGLTRQLLGKRFNTVNKIANLVMPTGSFDKASDQVLELLADFASTLSNNEHVLQEAGVDSLAKLQNDNGRSGRLAGALSEKNRYIGMAQGAISGATGVVGAAADIPFSMILALRTVYLTGRSYGFELNQPEDRALVFEALSNADLSLITEKQAILLGLRSVSGMLGTGNLQGLQNLLGSNNDVEPLIKLLSDANGQLKWKISPSIINRITPIIGGAVGAIYNGRLLKEVGESAKQVFEQARQQGLGNNQTANSLTSDSLSTDPKTANAKADNSQAASDTASKAESKPATSGDKLVGATEAKGQEAKAHQKEAQQAVLENDDIAKVEIVSRSEHDEQQLDDQAKDAQIHDQLAALADELVEPAAEDSQSTDNNKSTDNSADNEQSAAESDTNDDTAAGATGKKATPRARTAKSADSKSSDAKSTSAKADADASDENTTDESADTTKAPRRSSKAATNNSDTKNK